MIDDNSESRVGVTSFMQAQDAKNVAADGISGYWLATNLQLKAGNKPTNLKAYLR
jgi:hypothetical protein